MQCEYWPARSKTAACNWCSRRGESDGMRGLNEALDGRFQPLAIRAQALDGRFQPLAIRWHEWAVTFHATRIECGVGASLSRDCRVGRVWLDFNPWQWGDSDAIAKALFDEMADHLGVTTPGHPRVVRQRCDVRSPIDGRGSPLRDEASVTRVLTPLLTNLSLAGLAAAYGFTLPQVAKVAGVVAALALVSIGAGKLLSFLGRDRSAESLDVLRGNVEKGLRELKQPMVVFVDDIDRLEPEQIRLPRLPYPHAHRGRAFVMRPGLAAQFGERYARYGNVQVDAVEQGAGDLAAVAGDLVTRFGAPALSQ